MQWHWFIYLKTPSQGSDIDLNISLPPARAVAQYRVSTRRRHCDSNVVVLVPLNSMGIYLEILQWWGQLDHFWSKTAPIPVKCLANDGTESIQHQWFSVAMMWILVQYLVILMTSYSMTQRRTPCFQSAKWSRPPGAGTPSVWFRPRKMSGPHWRRTSTVFRFHHGFHWLLIKHLNV